jgi:CelD/BcsL family acetyltransferase involved in cellulose biosynthesis
MENIYIDRWDEEEFLNSKDEWNELLDRASADPLFLSWEWQSSWWRFFSDTENMELRIYVARTGDGKLVGIAPLFSIKTSIKNIFMATRLQFIGNCWRGKSTMPTELLEFIADVSLSEDVINAFSSHIYTLDDWDELVIPYLNVSSTTYLKLSDGDIFTNCYIRHAERFRSYFLKTTGSFQDYTKSLGKNTRLKLLNRRKNLEQMGEVKFKRMLADNIDKQFSLLNRLHEQRWGRPAFSDNRLAFNTAVASLMADKNSLNFSIITLDDEVISIQYNYVVNRHNYNIQAGFKENQHNKISLGYLHFGYEIEASFDQQYTAYDFLAGEGKNTQYKERLTDEHLEMVDLQIIRRPLLKALYRLNALLR